MTAVALIIVSIMKYTLGSDDYCDSARDDDCCALDYCVNCEVIARSLARPAVK